MLRPGSLCAASRLARGWRPRPSPSGLIFCRHYPGIRPEKPAHDFDLEEPLSELGEIWNTISGESQASALAGQESKSTQDDASKKSKGKNRKRKAKIRKQEMSDLQSKAHHDMSTSNGVKGNHPMPLPAIPTRQEQSTQQAQQPVAPAADSKPREIKSTQQAQQPVAPAADSKPRKKKSTQQAQQPVAPAAASKPPETKSTQQAQQPVATAADSKPRKKKSTQQAQQPVAPAAASKPPETKSTQQPQQRVSNPNAPKKFPDFSTRGAVRHLLGLPNGSLPALEVLGGPPVLLCVDLEAHEFRQKIILELGIATLDLNDTSNYPDSDPWSLLSSVEYRHFIVKEHRTVRNKKFAVSCPEKYLFGDSEVKHGKDIANIFRRFPETDPSRPVVLVGHDLLGDIKYLQSLGVKVRAWPNLVGTIDTQKLASKDHIPLNLEKMMAKLGVPALFPHNAGNDAAFTMQALLLFALRKDEWRSAHAMKEAKAFIIGRQNVKKQWLPQIRTLNRVTRQKGREEAQEEKKRIRKAANKSMRRLLERRGTARCLEMVVYDPTVEQSVGQQAEAL